MAEWHGTHLRRGRKREMRLYFDLSANREPVPFDYQHFVIGAFHKWLGKNELHDGVSLYSLSWLQRAVRDRKLLNFPHGAGWFVSYYDAKLTEIIMSAVVRDPLVCYGMKVLRVQKQETPNFGGRYRFKVASPILAREKKEDGSIKHLLYSDEGIDENITKTLLHKLDLAGMHEETQGLQVSFDRTYRFARTKLVTIKGIQNRANFCPVFVQGTERAVRFAWDVGIGNSTGSAFGALL